MVKILAAMETYFEALTEDTSRDFLAKTLAKQTTIHEKRQLAWVDFLVETMERRLGEHSDGIVNQDVIRCSFLN